MSRGDATGSSTSSSGGGWLPSAKPSWWSTVANFAQNPTRFIQKRVALWFVGGAIAAIEAVTGRVLWVWGIIADSVAAAGDSVRFAFGDAGDVAVDAAAIVPNLIESLGRDLGPIAGPVVVSVGGILVLFVLVQLLKRAPGALWTLYQLIPGT